MLFLWSTLRDFNLSHSKRRCQDREQVQRGTWPVVRCQRLSQRKGVLPADLGTAKDGLWSFSSSSWVMVACKNDVHVVAMGLDEKVAKLHRRSHHELSGFAH